MSELRVIHPEGGLSVAIETEAGTAIITGTPAHEPEFASLNTIGSNSES